MSILARKYNLVDPNATGKLITDDTNIKKHPVGHILPESIGSDKSLFENNQSQGENNLEIFQTKSLDSTAHEKDDSSLNPNLANIDSSLDLSMQDKNIQIADLEKFSPTLSTDQSVIETQGHHNSATTLHPVQDHQKFSGSQSVTGGMPLDTSLIEAGTVAICKKIELNPEKFKMN